MAHFEQYLSWVRRDAREPWTKQDIVRALEFADKYEVTSMYFTIEKEIETLVSRKHKIYYELYELALRHRMPDDHLGPLRSRLQSVFRELSQEAVKFLKAPWAREEFLQQFETAQKKVDIKTFTSSSEDEYYQHEYFDSGGYFH